MVDETIGNQQPSLSNIELGWLCGLIDGEGCIYICKRGGQRTDYKAGIKVAMCCHDTIEYLADLLKRVNVPYHIVKREGSKKNNRSASWALSIEGHKRALKILPLITPHLVTKKQQAQVVWQFCQERDNSWHRSPYTKGQIALIEIAGFMNQRGFREEGSTTIRKE